MKKFNLIFFLLLTTFFSHLTYSQEDIQIGKSLNQNQQYNRGAKFDYSDPEQINIKVLVWGYVEFPGQYIIPATSGVNDLLGLAGGPNQDAELDNLKLFRINPDSTQTVIQFDYNDLLWSDNKLDKPVNIPKLKAGDILLVPGEPRWFLRDYLSLGLSILGTLASVATLLVYVYRR